MQIRFSDAVVPAMNPAGLLAQSGYSCTFCGFSSMTGLTAYAAQSTEPLKAPETGARREIVACRVCLSFKHASIDPAPYCRLAWLPEIPQPFLSNLGRTWALVGALMAGETETSGAYETTNELYRRIDPRFYRELTRRADWLDDMIWAALGCAPHQIADAAGSTSVLSTLRGGLRMLPVAFDQKEIDEWRDDESSFQGISLSTLRDKNWFMGSVGRTSRGSRPVGSEGAGRAVS